jgi:hypothetical protein
MTDLLCAVGLIFVRLTKAYRSSVTASASLSAVAAQILSARQNFMNLPKTLVLLLPYSKTVQASFPWISKGSQNRTYEDQFGRSSYLHKRSSGAPLLLRYLPARLSQRNEGAQHLRNRRLEQSTRKCRCSCSKGCNPT